MEGPARILSRGLKGSHLYFRYISLVTLKRMDSSRMSLEAGRFLWSLQSPRLKWWAPEGMMSIMIIGRENRTALKAIRKEFMTDGVVRWRETLNEFWLQELGTCWCLVEGQRIREVEQYLITKFEISVVSPCAYN